jgi:hypothetical protein
VLCVVLKLIPAIGFYLNGDCWTFFYFSISISILRASFFSLARSSLTFLLPSIVNFSRTLDMRFEIGLVGSPFKKPEGTEITLGSSFFFFIGGGT